MTNNLTQDRKGRELWTKAFFTISLTALFTSMASQMVSNNMPLFVDQLGGRATYSGLLMTVYTIAALITRPIGGYLLDHKDRRLVMIAGCLLFSVATVAYNIFPYLAALPLIRFCQGIGFAVASTASATAILGFLPKERFAEGIGYYGLASALAMAIGPSLGLYLIFDEDFSLMFGGAALIILISALAFSLNRFPKTAIAGVRAKAGAAKISLKDRLSIWSLIEKKALVASTVQLIVSMSSCSIYVFLTLFAKTKGIQVAGLFFIIAAGFMMLSRLVAGRVIDKKGPLFVITPALILCTASYLMLAYADSEGVFLLAGAIFGFATGMSTPALNFEAVRYAAANRRGAASATYLISLDIGFGLGAALGGVIIDHWGFRSMYIGAIICILLSLAVSAAFMRKPAEILISPATTLEDI